MLSVWIGVGGCEWPNSIRIWRIISAFFALVNTPVILASAADDMTWQRMEHSAKIGPLSGGSIVGGWSGSDLSVVRKK